MKLQTSMLYLVSALSASNAWLVLPLSLVTDVTYMAFYGFL
jgi:hypothetical protein